MGEDTNIYITRAAVMFSNGEVIEGRSYAQISRLARKLGLSGDCIYGFLDSAGEFVLPQEAAVAARNAGQLSSDVPALTPDDLWPVMQTY